MKYCWPGNHLECDVDEYIGDFALIEINDCPWEAVGQKGNRAYRVATATRAGENIS
jgi:hypothetical protein